MPESSYRTLKRPAGVEVIEQVAFVRLVPTDLAGRDSAQVQPAHVGRGEQPPDRAAVARDRRDYQARTQTSRDILLADRDHARIWDQELAVGERMLGGNAENNRRQPVRAPLVDCQAAALPVRHMVFDRGYHVVPV